MTILSCGGEIESRVGWAVFGEMLCRVEDQRLLSLPSSQLGARFIAWIQEEDEDGEERRGCVVIE